MNYSLKKKKRFIYFYKINFQTPSEVQQPVFVEPIAKLLPKSYKDESSLANQESSYSSQEEFRQPLSVITDKASNHLHSSSVMMVKRAMKRTSEGFHAPYSKQMRLQDPQGRPSSFMEREDANNTPDSTTTNVEYMKQEPAAESSAGPSDKNSDMWRPW